MEPPSFHGEAVVQYYEGNRYIPPAILAELSRSYEDTLAFIKKDPRIVTLRRPDTQETGLHGAIRGMHVDPGHFIPLVAFVSALLECGADKTTVEATGQMPIELALAYELPLVVDLLTQERVNKGVLLDLATRHGQHDLVRWLNQDTFSVNDNNVREPDPIVLEQGRSLVVDIALDPTNVYEKTWKYYSENRRLLASRFELTGNTMLHEAISSYCKGHVFGAVEALVILQMGGDRFCRNHAGKTPHDLAEGCELLRVLLGKQNPTKEVLVELACELMHNSCDPQLNQLVEWLTNE